MSSGDFERGTDHLAMPAMGLVFKVAAEAGLDFRAALQELKLPYRAEDFTLGRSPQMPRAHAMRLYRLAMDAICAHERKTQGRMIITVEETEMMCRCIVNARNLEDAILLAARFNAMLDTRHVQLNLRIEQGMAAFSMETFRETRTRFNFVLDLFGLSFYHQLFSWLIGEDIALGEVALVHEELVSQDVTRALFGRSVRFLRPVNGFSFPESLLKRPVLRNYNELVELQKQFQFEIMPSHLTSDSVTHRLSAILKAALLKNSAFPPLNRTAALLNQSSMTLRRRLAAEGATVSELKQKIRQELAVELLTHSHFSIDEISDRLGFSAPSAFRRAFRSWMGTSASEFRAASSGVGRAPAPASRQDPAEEHCLPAQ